MLKEIINAYRQHVRQPELQQIDAEGHVVVEISKLCRSLQFGKITKSYKSHMRHILSKI